jgi:hypothetical protein
MAALENVCKFHQFGHCKFGSQCKKRHTINTCTNFPCKNMGCPMRHPRISKFFTHFARCKFDNQCSYLHTIASESSTRDLASEIDEMKEEIETLKSNCQALKMEILKLNSAEEQVPSLPLPCDEYDIVCENDDKLKQHKKTFHAEIFKCDFCNYETTSRKGVNIHKGSKHKNLKTVSTNLSSSVSTETTSSQAPLLENPASNPPLPCRNRSEGCTQVIQNYFDKFVVICEDCIASMKSLQKSSPFSSQLCPACHQPSENGKFSFCSLCKDWIHEDGFRDSDWGSWTLNRDSGEIICIQLEF